MLPWETEADFFFFIFLYKCKSGGKFDSFFSDLHFQHWENTSLEGALSEEYSETPQPPCASICWI